MENRRASTLPLVSIGVPVHNEERHLAAALSSLLAQDYENLEIIISDNASTDATPGICAEFAARDDRITYHRNESNLGAVANFNRAFEISNGEYFTWASGHDLRDSTYLSQCMKIMLEDPSVVLSHTQAVWIDDQAAPQELVRSNLDTRSFPDQLSRLHLTMWGIVEAFAICGVIRSPHLKATSLYRRVYSPDVALLIELSLLGKFAFIPQTLLFARKAADHGSVPAYLLRLFPDDNSSAIKSALFWRMITDLCVRVVRQTSGGFNKFVALVSVPFCMLTKYRWMLSNLTRK